MTSRLRASALALSLAALPVVAFACKKDKPADPAPAARADPATSTAPKTKSSKSTKGDDDGKKDDDDQGDDHGIVDDDRKGHDVPKGDDEGAAPATSAPGPVTIKPAIPAFEMGMMDHATVLGWSTDSSEFGYCNTSGGSGGQTCFFERTSGAIDKMSDFNLGKGEIDPAKSGAIASRAKTKGYGASGKSWPFGGDITLRWQTVSGTVQAIMVGGELAGEAPIFPITSPAPKDAGVHVETIAVSPDGKFVGVVSHSFAGEFSDSFDVQVMSSTKFAAQVYNDAGMAHHKKADYARAAELFDKAAGADVTAELPMYNLACAYARLSDGKAQHALEQAIARGGEKVKKRAVGDDDFAKVKGETWFSDLTK